MGLVYTKWECRADEVICQPAGEKGTYYQTLYRLSGSSTSMKLRSIAKALEVKHEGEAGQTTYLQNKDIIPMGPQRRTWGAFTYGFYWSLFNVSLATWAGASSLLSLGLSVGETMGAIVIGNLLIASWSLLNAAPGGKYHIGYTINQRVVFGIRGSLLPIIMRIILSVVWYASESYLGSLCLNCVFASWSKNYLYLKNTIPQSVQMSTQQLIGLVCYHVIGYPLLLIRPERLKHGMIICVFLNFFVFLGITIWAVHINGGNGPLMSSSGKTLSSSARGWAWVKGICTWYGNLCAGVTNQADYTRFSKKPWSSFWGTWFSLMIVSTMIPLMGVVTASALKGHWGGELLWRPDEIIMTWLEKDYSAKARAAAFFCGAILSVTQLIDNAIGNGFEGGMDLSGIMPRYIDVKRGAVITAVLLWVAQPWTYYNGASTFMTVISSFSIFMTPIIAIATSDFWVIRRRKLKLSDMYTDNPRGNYWYKYGVNWQSIVVLLVACVPGIPGLCSLANPNIKVNTGITNFYSGAALFEYAIAFSLNIALSYLFPYKNPQEHDQADFFDTYTSEECDKLGIIPFSELTPEERITKKLTGSADENSVSIEQTYTLTGVEAPEEEAGITKLDKQ